MLTGLSIRNIVLIERLDLTFSDGLSVLTGETGAGKSILLDSLSLALGARSEARLLRPGADSGRVTATFELTPDHPLQAILAEHDLPADETLVLRRVLTADGRTRAYVNDEPTSVNLLRRLGDSLIEIQGQFEERGLLNPSTHRGLLDAYGALETQRNETAGAYHDWRAAIEARSQAESEAARAKQDEDYLRHALAELQELNPAMGEETRLADTRNMLQNAEALLAALTDSFAELDGENAAESRLRAALGRLDRIADKAAGRLEAAQAALERAIAETQESMRAIRAVADDIQVGGEDLESIEERLFTLRDVARKHGVAVDDLPDLCERIAARVDSIESEADTLDRLRQAESQARDRYVAGAKALSAARREAAARLDAAVTAELPPLKLEKAQFMTVLKPLAEDQWSPDGIDRVSFQVSTNTGAPPGPLTKIASGGELSRFMLALK
ncbi:MAG: DNA repair protein RecN, partial [Alphaproteobacteria bacterium]|nr:DNA repair protein RecN [Alphaproteobacteria bacterium]